MLQEVIDLHDEAVSNLVKQLYTKNEITFKAPTGSGKTHMMADLMDRILNEHKDVVFLVSSLSKSELAKQNYDNFCKYKEHGEFKNLKPYLISSEVSGEESLFIPIDYNVYILPRDLYKKGGRLMQGAMESFLQTVTRNLFGKGLNKIVYLIKDECHIATNNLDSLSVSYFSKIMNCSATPNLKRNQLPDVEITEEQAVNAKLIKTVEWHETDSGVEDAISKFEEIKDDYRDKLGVNPCLIIQISNKDKANEELSNIYSILNKSEHQDLKWMLIVDKDKDCNTNDVFKAKRMPVNRWKDYAKENESTIDIIIFKMVITEGWDIPRACMLYQVRDTQSKQLDEQVIGRVRRNPRLLDFEKLSPDAQELAAKAWVWGIKDKNKQKTYIATLFEEPTDITNHIRIKTTKLKTLKRKPGFDIHRFMSECGDDNRYSDIFSLYRKLSKTAPEIRDMCYDYAETGCDWLRFTENIDSIVKESNQYVCDYSKSMELTTDYIGQTKEVSFPVESMYTDNGNYANISDWVWRRKEGSDKFAFDSDAEREWAGILKDLAKDDTNEPTPQRVAKRVKVGKRNPKAGQKRIDGSFEPDKQNTSDKYLWGKNFISNSEIKYEYCLEGIHSSYPDFIMEDCFGRIHLFEVKSVNLSNSTNAGFDSAAYKTKIEELKKCYKQSSMLTGHIFYLPVMKDDIWHITRLMNGEECTLTKSEFENFIKTAVKEEKSESTSIQIAVDIPDSDKFTRYLPVYPLRAACGYFDDCGSLPDEDAEGWVDVSKVISNPHEGMFVIHAEGKSMETKIHDGDLCVFDSVGAGSHDGDIVLCKAKDKDDPNASSFTIKKYSSEKVETEDGWKHSKITLSPLNADFKPIVLTEEEVEEGDFKIYGVFKEVLKM